MHTAARTRRTRVLLLMVAFGFLCAVPARAQRGESGMAFAVIGDSGTGTKEQFAVAQAMERAAEKDPFKLVLMLGDNIYGGRGPKQLVDKFEAPYRNLLARGVTFQASLGNHDGGRAQEEINYNLFNMGGRRFYTFTQGEGLAQFFALDSSQMDREQTDWLEKELAASTARWKVAFFHHPLFSSGRTHGSNPRLQKILEPIFVRHGVQLVLSGHDHFYERIKPRQGVAYFVSGAAGKLRRGNINRKDPLLAAGNDETMHFMLFRVGRDEIRFQAIGTNNEILDEGVIPYAPPAH